MNAATRLYYRIPQLRRIVDAGLDDVTTPAIAKSVRLTNILALFHIAIVLLYFPVFIALNHPIGRLYVPINMVEALLFAVTWRLNATGRHYLASLWLIASASLLMITAIVVFGKATNVYYYLLTGAVSPLVILGHARQRTAMVISSLFLLTFLGFELAPHWPPIAGGEFDPSMGSFFARLNVVGVFTLLFALGYYASRAAASAENALAALNRTLETRVAERTEALAEREQQLQHAQKMEAIGRLAATSTSTVASAKARRSRFFCRSRRNPYPSRFKMPPMPSRPTWGKGKRSSWSKTTPTCARCCKRCSNRLAIQS